VIIGCLVRAVAHLRGVYMYGTMMEWWLAGENQKLTEVLPQYHYPA
jgi:hypothetical protein